MSEFLPGAPRALSPDDALDAALVERVRRGDARAFDELVGRHMRRAFGVAYRLMGHREDAEDLVQESFLAALERIETFQPGRGFAPWFFRILVNRGLNARKSRSLRTTEEIPASAAAGGASPDREAERTELRGRLRAALAGLPERQRTVVQLFELEGFSSPEIAVILGITEGTVRWHLHAARRALRQALAPTGPPPGDTGATDSGGAPGVRVDEVVEASYPAGELERLISGRADADALLLAAVGESESGLPAEQEHDEGDVLEQGEVSGSRS